MLQLSEIYTYPIKSLGGIRLQSTNLTPQGVQYDRRWMLVDANGQFLTQRQFPKMAWLQPILKKEGIEIQHKQLDISPLFFPFQPQTNELLQVQVWKSVCTALAVSAEADRWFSKALDTPCRLVYMPNSTKRKVNPAFDRGEDIVSFADGYPYLIIGQEALNDLNSRLAAPLPMNRFRPNFVFTGGTAYEDDLWQTIKIGDTIFDISKACGRCIITTIDQQTLNTSKEPLKTLATYRTKNNMVLFGQCLLSVANGVVSTGNVITVLEKQSCS